MTVRSPFMGCKLIYMFVYMVSLCGMDAQNIKFEHYNDNNGLSHNSVRHIVQDDTGFLWLGTFSGLNRFDGYQFKSYTSALPGPNKIYNDDITALELDEDSNNLWIGTRNGLTLFKTDTHTFSTFLPEKDNPDSLPDNEIRSVYVDKFKRVWVGTKTMGVYMFFPVENRFSKVNIEGFDYIKEIFEDQKGHIWIGTYGKGSVAKISLDHDGNIVQLIKYTLPIPGSKGKNPYINFIYEDHKSDIFIGTREGLYQLDTETNSFVNLYIADDEVRDNLGPYFLSVARAPDGKYWVGTLGGLLVCNRLEDVAKGDFQWHYAVLSDDTSLVDNLVSALYFDASGVLWIGTEDGLDKYDPYENQFKLNTDISFHIGNQVPRIRGFSKTFDGKVIVATRHNGLFISREERFDPLYNGQKDIASIYSDDGKIFYCGLWNGKILVYDYQRNTSEVIVTGFESPIFAFAKMGGNNLMVGSFGEGAVLLDTDTRKPRISMATLLPGYQINKIVRDNAHNLWFATETGVVRYNKGSGKIKEYNAGARPELGVPHDNVSDVMIGPKGKVWAATRMGLGAYDPSLDDFKAVSEPKELAGKWITDMVTDTNGDVWLNMNNNSVARFKTDTKDINVYHVNSGNRLDVFSSSGFYNFDNSHIYLGGKNGIIYFSPYTILENQWSPRPFITEFKIQNKVVFPGMEINGQKPLTRDLNLGKKVELNYKNRNFSFQFSTPSYANERLNTFEYMLEGFDADWISANSNSRTIQYTNLYPDDYVFKIKSGNSDGHWSEVVSYQIRILPPFWLTYKALLLFLVFSFILIYLARKEIKHRTRLKEELLMEKVKRERDEKLNNEKLRFFTNISHELRTPLTLILGPAKQLIEEGEETGNKYQQSRFNLIHQNASRLLNLVNQILDFRKAQTGELKLRVSKTDILLHTRNTFHSFKELANNKHIHLNFICENSAVFGWIDKDKYDKILYNLLSNALKFTGKYGNVDLFIGLKDDMKGYLVIEVSDDGIGIPIESQKKIFSRFYQAANSKENNTGSGIGLSLVKSLVKLHKGKIRVLSAPNKGCVFTVEIPIGRDFYKDIEVFDYTPEQLGQESLQLSSAKKIIQSTHLKEKILIVEDNIELRKYLVDYLSDYYKVYDAENGEDGLKVCRQIKPVLCVADVMMPIMDGLQFCKELKNDEFISHIPVVLLTALAENEDKIKGYDTGADGYLVKPFVPSLLRTRIANIIKSRRELKAKFSEEVESGISLLTHSPIDEEFMAKVTDLIERNLSKVDLTTTFLCRELGMSSSKLYRKIKELTDLAPNEFIRTLRLKKSAQLLKTKKYNVSEVTNFIGFNDPLYFSRCFKKQFGFPPSRLIK